LGWALLGLKHQLEVLSVPPCLFIVIGSLFRIKKFSLVSNSPSLQTILQGGGWHLLFYFFEFLFRVYLIKCLCMNLEVGCLEKNDIRDVGNTDEFADSPDPSDSSTMMTTPR